MAETRSEDLKKLHLRADLPKYFRYGAIALAALVIAAIVINLLVSREPEFRMKSFPTNLSQDVVAEINGYERTEYDNGARKYYVKADKAVTFSDNHQELENAFIEIFDATGEKSDKISSQKAIYIPEENKNFTAYLAGTVNIETRDSLKIETDQVTYKKSDETAIAEEPVKFKRDNIEGNAIGSTVKILEKKIELHKDVEIRQFETAELTGDPSAKINAGSASYDQLNERIDLHQGTKIHSISRQPVRTTDISSQSAVIQLVAVEDGNKRDIKTAELFENVAIDSTESGKVPTKIRSGYALYDRPADKFDLKNGVNIVTAEDQTPTTINSANAVYEQMNGVATLQGSADITQGNNFAKGDHIVAHLFPSRKLKNAYIRGNGYVRQIDAERTLEVSGAELNAGFADGQDINDANALNNATTVITPAKPDEYSRVTMSAPRAIRLRFKQPGIIEQMLTEGRTTIQLDSPNNAPDSSNKRVTADVVKTFFAADGKNIQKAEAAGNAELFVEPLKASVENYKTTVNAPRFDCEFFPTGNNARSCVGGQGTKTVRVPTVAVQGRGNQILTADKLTTTFSQTTRDVERFDATGNAKFNEIDRNGISDEMSFTSADGTVRLRGGEPTVWDSKARAKAQEIDWDTKNEKSFLRSGVSTTYYSQESSGGATPFGQTKKPVFVTASNAEFDHKTQVAVYSGNARGWQDKSYVRADKFTILQKQGQFNADGGVNSLLYDVKRKENGKESLVPVSAASNSMNYFRDNRLLRYTGAVDIRQATDRITGGKADVYMSENNEVSKTEVEQNVVITQPKRKASGDFASYTAANEIVVLRGDPAKVEDAENGTSQAGEMTLYMRENRVNSVGQSRQNTTGRSRSVYKIKEN